MSLVTGLAIEFVDVAVVFLTELDLILVCDLEWEQGFIISLICYDVERRVLLVSNKLILPLPLLNNRDVTSGVSDVFLESICALALL